MPASAAARLVTFLRACARNDYRRAVARQGELTVPQDTAGEGEHRLREAEPRAVQVPPVKLGGDPAPAQALRRLAGDVGPGEGVEHEVAGGRAQLTKNSGRARGNRAGCTGSPASAHA